MKTDMKVYDKNGKLLHFGDILLDKYGMSTLENHYDEIYICGKIDMWRIEEFNLDNYKDGIKLVDFEYVNV